MNEHDLERLIADALNEAAAGLAVQHAHVVVGVVRDGQVRPPVAVEVRRDDAQRAMPHGHVLPHEVQIGPVQQQARLQRLDDRACADVD